MKDLILKRLTTIHQRLIQEGKLTTPITDIDGVEIYSNKDRDYFGISWAQIEVSVSMRSQNVEITFKDFDGWEGFSWSNWLEDVEKLTV